jgi:uncharacterized phage protein (TIGR02216 family)
MAAGFGLLALSPAAFWSMTLKELEAAIRGRLGLSAPGGAPSRSEFEALLQRYPDMESPET